MRSPALRHRPGCVLLLLVLAGCQLERLQPESVGVGVARLTVRNAAALTTLVNADARCGFASPGVLAAAQQNGEVGRPGSITWTVEGCTVDLGELHPASEDCNGLTSELGGRVTLWGTKTVEGLLTGNPDTPVVPDAADATRLELRAELDGFIVRRANSPNVLTQRAGTLSWTALPHLAVSKSNGLCSVSTSDLTLSAVKYENAVVLVQTADRSFDVEVPTSDLSAQLGKWAERENALEGTLTVWDARVAVPTRDDPRGLDPEYDPEQFARSYACKPDLELPVSYACPSMVERVAQGGAQLTISAFGNLAAYVDEEQGCGFASPKVLARPEVFGTIGERGGSVTWRISQPCLLRFASPTPARTDCHGVVTSFEGTVEVTGTKTVRGILTGDPAAPVVPTSWEPAELALQLRFDHFTVSDSSGAKALKLVRGQLSGTSRPRTAVDRRTGACSVKTRIARFTNVSLADAELEVLSDGNRFHLPVASSSLEAQSGPGTERTNYLAGTLNAYGAIISLPANGNSPVLDPSYDPDRFEASFSCPEHLEVARSDEQCSFHQPLAEAAARLLVQNTAVAASLINADGRCGFDNNWVKLNPTEVVGKPGEMGRMSWQVERCELGQATPAVLEQGCTGAQRVQTGLATVTARRTITGERDKQLLVVDSIIPRSRDAVTLSLSDVQLTGFSAATIPVRASAPPARLTLHRGKLSAVVRPILGERKSKPSVFDVRTPVAALSDVVLTDGRARLESGARTFMLTLPEVKLTALNGSYRGKSNTVEGTVRFPDRTVRVGPMPLDPTFDQAAFDASYACTSDLKEVIPAR